MEGHWKSRSGSLKKTTIKNIGLGHLRKQQQKGNLGQGHFKKKEREVPGHLKNSNNKKYQVT